MSSLVLSLSILLQSCEERISKFHRFLSTNIRIDKEMLSNDVEQKGQRESKEKKRRNMGGRRRRGGGGAHHQIEK